MTNEDAYKDGYLRALADVEKYCEAMKESCREARFKELPQEAFPSEWFEGRAAGYEEIAIHCRSENFFSQWSGQSSILEIDGQS